MTSSHPYRRVCTTCDNETEEVDEKGLPQCDDCARYFRWVKWVARGRRGVAVCEVTAKGKQQ